MANPKRDPITGTWQTTNKKLVATWTTSNNKTSGFYVKKDLGPRVIGLSSDIYVDKNRNGNFDPRRDKKIGTLVQTDRKQPLWAAGSGTWNLGGDAPRIGSVFNSSFEPIGVTYFTDLSFF